MTLYPPFCSLDSFKLSGGSLLFAGILTLALAMLAWRRRRNQLKKKQIHV